MMKLFFILMFFFFIMNFFKKKMLQIYYQNMLFLMFFYMELIFPLNNNGVWLMIYNNFGMDYYSWGLVMLSIWILSLMILYSEKIYLQKFFIYFILLMNFMLMFLILCFSSMNLILFYLYFESSLIPVFILILGWGYQVERIQAGLYMMLYTLFGSMPLFLMIIYLYSLENTLLFNLISIKNYLNMYIYLSLILGFLIKMPMYLFHSWLPKAHVEAPIMGSMILAGVMLKLGGYGLLRVMLIMMSLSLKFNKFFLVFSLMGGVFSSLICLCQVDMKMLVAYSSVVHMSLTMSGLMTMFNWGYIGGFLMMMAHGLCSSGLFCLVNINYERLMSRSLFINKGLINIFPSLSMMWFLLSSSNLSFPPSLNMFSEIMLFNSILIWSGKLMLLIMLILFFSACYTLYLYSYSQHGKLNFLGVSFLMINIKEYMLLIFHWFPLNFMFFMMMIFI